MLPLLMAPGFDGRTRARSTVPEPARCQQQRVRVDFDYPVVFTQALFSNDNDDLLWALTRNEPHRTHRVFVVIDDGVVRAQPELIPTIEQWFGARPQQVKLAAAPHVVPGGEAAKNDAELVSSLLSRFQAARLDRQSFVLIVGGGAVLDAVGYAASTAHRGLRVVRAPTTVLSQNDAGIGVKNGVNAFGTKNFLGTFSPPFAVLNDIDFIKTLDPRDRRSGIAEAVKVACIRDGEFFGWLEDHRSALAASEPAAMDTMIQRCAELHLQHIRDSGDPFEMGSARPLDFGHWAAHRLEALSKHALRHGEAVAIGVALDARYSALTQRIDEASQQRVWNTLLGVGFSLWHDCLDQRDADGRLSVLAGLVEFREHLGGELTVTLLEAIGRGVETHEMDEAIVCQAIADLRRAAGA